MSRFNWDHIFTPTFLSHFAVRLCEPERRLWFGDRAESESTFRRSRTRPLITLRPPPASAATGLRTLRGWGNTQGPGYLNKTTRPTYIANELMTWVHGAHTIKFGGEFRHLAASFPAEQQPVGHAEFCRAVHRHCRACHSGDPFASLLHRRRG